MLGARTCLALLPVVDRLGGRADEKAAFCGRQSKASPLRRHALRAEAGTWRDGVLVGRRGWRRLPCAANSAKQALDLEHSPLQGGDLGTVSGGGFLEGGRFASDLFASDPGDFLFQSRCDIR